MRRALFIGCHVDDIELGCGGLLSKRLDNWDCYCVTLSRYSFSPQGEHGEHPNIWKCQQAALKFLGYKKQIAFYSHRTNYFEEERQRVYSSLKWQRDHVKPNIVFINHDDDHQDHATTYREALRVFPDVTLLTYPTYGSIQVFPANHYEVLLEEDVDQKVLSLAHYPMYKDKPYIKNIKAQCQADGTYIKKSFAEKYHIVRSVE